MSTRKSTLCLALAAGLGIAAGGDAAFAAAANGAPPVSWLALCE